MRLIIADRTYGDVDGRFYVDVALMREPGVHMFIASHHWDEIVINDITKLPDMKVSMMDKVADKITVDLPSVITEETMHKLVALFPAYAGRIRRCYLVHGDMKEVIRNCLDQ